MANEITIRVTAKDDASKTFDIVDRKARGLGKTFADVGKIAGGFLAANVIAGAAGKVIGFLGESTKAASDLNENLSKSNIIFKENAKEIEDWASSGAKNFGLSKSAALDAAGSFGNMFDQLDFGVQESTKMSKSITELAADFASFHNADITDVINAQSSAFRGEYDALQRFLPLINAASVQQKAMEITGKENAAALTQQEKALATYQLMLEGAGEAQGNFAATSDEAANKGRIQQAAYENLQATLGQKLLPVQLAVTEAKIKFIDFLVTKAIPTLEDLYDKHWPAISEAMSKVGKVVKEDLWPPFKEGLDTVGPLVEKFVNFILDNKETTIAAIIAIGVAIVVALGPVSAAALAITAIITLIGLAKQNWDELKKAMEEGIKVNIPGLGDTPIAPGTGFDPIAPGDPTGIKKLLDALGIKGVFHSGGMIPQTGNYVLQRGEQVIPAGSSTTNNNSRSVYINNLNVSGGGSGQGDIELLLGGI